MNPFDMRFWQAGSQLAWWDSKLADPPRWLPSREEAQAYIEAHKVDMWHLLRLLVAFRTMETGQIHALVPRLPASKHGKLYLCAARLGFCDLGFPIRVDGTGRVNPFLADFTALRLPKSERIEKQVKALGFSPMHMQALGPFPLRGTRQYDRHNLIATHLAVAAKQRGFSVAGEAWGRFDLMTGIAGTGGGGPDLEMIDETQILCVELTASVTMIDEKIRVWEHNLLLPNMEHVHVLWLCAGFTPDIQTVMEHKIGDNKPRMHVADAREFAQTFTTSDGTVFSCTPQQVDAYDWVRANFARLGSRFGLDNMGEWSIPQGLRVPELFSYGDA